MICQMILWKVDRFRPAAHLHSEARPQTKLRSRLGWCKWPDQTPGNVTWTYDIIVFLLFKGSLCKPNAIRECYNFTVQTIKLNVQIKPVSIFYQHVIIKALTSVITKTIRLLMLSSAKFTCVLMNPWSQRKATELPSWNWSPYLWPLTGTPGSWHSFWPKATDGTHTHTHTHTERFK